MTTIPVADIPSQLRKATEAIAVATGHAPNLYRPAGELSNDAVRAEAGKQGLAEILWDVNPFDWINDANLCGSPARTPAAVRSSGPRPLRFWDPAARW